MGILVSLFQGILEVVRSHRHLFAQSLNRTPFPHKFRKQDNLQRVRHFRGSKFARLKCFFFQLVMALFFRRFHFFCLKLPFLFYGFGSQMGHKLPMPFLKQATILTTYLYLKPARITPDELWTKKYLITFE